MGRILFGGTAALLICIFLSPKFIEFLRVREFGQHIREDGPQGHHQKAGTPTMGGRDHLPRRVGVPFLILTNYEWRSVGVFAAAIACALLGFADDYIKLVTATLARPARAHEARRHDRDLAGAVVHRHGTRRTCRSTLWLRFVDYHIDLGPLLSGADLPRRGGHHERGQPHRRPRRARGRLRGDRAARLHRHHASSRGDFDLAMLAGCLVGACIGFLWFNAFPATIFMGDTGSLGLGGAIAGLAVMTKTEVLLILLGGIFVIEALSVVIQVISFQTTRKRVFLMAPIHHHFELKAWSETKIILRFWIVASICAAIGFTIYRQSRGV